MTVTAESIVPTSFNLDGVSTVFTAPFKVFEADHVQAYIVDAAGVETLLTLNSGYTVTGVGEAQCTVTLASAAGTSGQRLVLARVLPLTRETELAPGPLPPEELDADADRVVMMVQQLQEQIGRAVLQAISTTARGLAFPSPPAVGDTTELIGWSDDRTTLVNRKVEQDQVEPPDSQVTTKYPADAGLVATSGTDNSATFNAFLQDLSDAGGGEFVGDGNAYEFQSNVLIPSFVTVRGLKAKLGPTATLAIAGRDKVAFSGIRLTSAASAGATTMVWDTAPLGGGLISSYAKIGSTIGIKDGLNDETASIVDINDGTREVTLAAGLRFAYSTAGTTISIGATARITVDTVLRADQVVVDSADVALLAVGDFVGIEDNRRLADGPIYYEIRQVVGVETAGDNIISLSGQLRRVYQAAENARLVVLDPAVRAAVIGCSVECIGTAASDRFDPLFEISRGLDCVMVDCDYPGTDAVGRRGPMHNIHKSYNCHMIRPTGRNPLYTEDGEGNGARIIYSTRCSVSQPSYQATRHALQFICATECAGEEVDSAETLLTAISFHGFNSVGCYVTLRSITMSSRTASSSNGVASIGNSTWLAGDHECLIMDGQIGPFDGNSAAYGFRFFPPSTNCYVKGVHAVNVDTFCIHRDIAGAGTLVTENCGLIDCSADGSADRIIDLQGKASGASVKTLKNFLISNFQATNLFRGILAWDVDGLTLHNVRLRYGTADTVTMRRALSLKRIDTLRCIDVFSQKANRGLDFEDCPDALFLKCDWLDLGDTQWLKDDGGNDGTEFRGCNAYVAGGAAATSDVTGGSTIVYKAVSNIGIETTTAYTFSATDKLLARTSSGGGTAEEAAFTDSGQAMVAAASARAQNDLLFGVGTSIASAATVDLSTATEVAVTVTGTTTITSFGTVVRGIRFVSFAASLTLTHNATSLILPGGANIQTAAGDVAFMYSLGSGNWKCMAYVRAGGSLATQLASAVAITGGSIAGITDIAVADGGTGASTAVAALGNLTTKGADIASATTTDLATATGTMVDITGTTTITGLGTLAAGVLRILRFTGILTLTHNGTSLILPGAENITTAAGDRALFMSLGSGNWLCITYSRTSSVGALAITEESRSLKASTNFQTGTTYTLAAADNGKVIDLSNASGITVTLPNSLAVGFYCTLVQSGAGQVTLSPDSGAVIRSRQTHTKTAGQYAAIGLFVRSNAGSAANYILTGDTAA
jgi:hypothetical protein